MDASAIAFGAGIVGAGGAGFPTHVKLAAKAGRFIVNAAECEPLIEVDKFLIRTRAHDLVRGAVEMARAVGAGSVIFAIKKAYKNEIACLNEAISKITAPGASPDKRDTQDNRNAPEKRDAPDDRNAPDKLNMPDISVLGMRTFYPAGDEQLIALLATGKTVPERGIPLDVGAVVDNVATVLNFYDASGFDGTPGRPVTHRVLSVTGAVNKPVMLRVPVGTNVKLCIEAAGGCAGGSGIVMGGPMMGKFYDYSDAELLFIKKTDGNILVLPPGHKLPGKAKLDVRQLQNRARAACIRCRMCTDLCPRYLTGHNVTPHVVMQNFYRVDNISDDAEFERAFGSAANCCECGLCENYACPMMLSPRRVNVSLKPLLRERGIDPKRNMQPSVREFFEEKLVPTGRLTARLGLAQYAKHLGDELVELRPDRVSVSLRQQIGAPCIPCVSQGARVSEGELIAAPPEGKLGANLHAPIDGIVAAIEKEAIVVASG